MAPITSYADGLLERSVHRFALCLAVFVALSTPFAYWFVAYQDYAKSLDFKAKVKASSFACITKTAAA